MAKAFKVTVDLSEFLALTSKFKTLDGVINDAATATAIGKIAVQGIKEFTEVGTSPIRGKLRFAAYINPTRYPGNRKPRRPVNLRLSGDFMDALTYKLSKDSSGYSVNVGYFDTKNAKKEQGHREGANGQPKRPTIPVQGEDFNVTIQTAMEARYALEANKILKKF